MNTPVVQWSAISPELILLGTACFLLVTGAFMQGASARRFSASVALLAFLGASVASLLLWDHDTWLVMSGQLRLDRFTTIIRLLVAVAGLVTVLSSWGTRRLDDHIGEYYALLLTAAAGMSLLAGVNGFVTLFVALELFSLALYILCALDITSRASLEAGLKYLVIGSVGSAFLLFGSGLIYGGTKSLRFDGIIQSIQSGGTQHEELILLGIGDGDRRPGLQGLGGAVPHVDARRLRGRSDGDHRLHGRGHQDGRPGGAAAGAGAGLRAGQRRLGGRRRGHRDRLDGRSATSPRWPRPTPSACWPTPRSHRRGTC